MKSWFVLSLIAAALLPVVSAQTGVVVSTFVGGVATPVQDSATVPLQSDGRDALASFTVSNLGSSAVTLNQLSLSGSDFALSAAPSLPASIPANGVLLFTIRYRPSARASAGLVGLGYTEASQNRALTFNLAGTAPEYAYFLGNTNGQRLSIAPGARLGFPATRPGSSSTQTLIISNRGAAAGTILSVAGGGGDFTVGASGNITIPVGQEISIPITFSPRARGTTSSVLTVDTGTGIASFGLEGVGAAPDFVVAYALRTDGNVRSIGNDGRITFAPTPAATTAIAEVIIGNQGNGSGSLRSVTLSGNSFQLASLPLLPATIEAGQTLRFLIQFNPRQLGTYTGSLRVELDDRTVNATVEGSTSNPDLSLSYVDPVTRNIVAVPQGSALSFPSTTVNATTAFTVVLRNRGEGTGFVNAINVNGEAFRLADVPALPFTIEPSRELRFGLQFTPKERDIQSGSLSIELPAGTLIVPLSGSGMAPELTFEVTNGTGAPSPLPSGSELAFSTAVGQTESKVIRITNQGNSEAQITTLSITGAGFQLANFPFLPFTIPVGGSQAVTVSFTPVQPNVSRGRLRIGDQNFDVAGTGIAPRLEFAFTNEAGTTAVTENGGVVLSPARVGESSSAVFSIQNTGTSSIVVSTIAPGTVTPVFTIEDVPALPVRLEPGGELRFNIRFTPNNTGNLTNSLRVNNTSFALTGNGRQPVPLPDQRIDGPSGVQAPLQQPAVGLSLVAPYSLPLRGTLALTFVSDVFSENPAVQFATGGRGVNFTIPANSTRAVFENGASEVRLQTGTVAGAIQLRPTFSTQAGLDLTPQQPPAFSININRAAPRLLTAEVASRGTNTLTLLVTGYSTTRSLRQLEIRLTPRGDRTFSTTSISQSIEAASLVWFQSAQSEALGGIFSLTIPLNLQRSGSTTDLMQYLQSVSITVSNEVGTSNEVSATP